MTFSLTVGGADAGTLVVLAPVSGTSNYGGSFRVLNAQLKGAATVNAVLHRTGLPDLSARQVDVTLDQEAPSLASGWDGGPWVARAGSFAVQAALSDDYSGVTGAQLTALFDGGITSPGVLDGGSALFTVRAAAVSLPGQLSSTPFKLTAVDRVGNLATLGPSAALILRVDDQPPALVPNTSVTWIHGIGAVAGIVTDQAGSGVDTHSLQLLAGGTATPGSIGNGTFTGSTDFGALAGPNYEGTYPYQVVASDLVGNQADAGGVVYVDNTPPSVSPLAVTTPADGTNSATGISYYKSFGGDVAISTGLDGGAGSPLSPASAMTLNAGSGSCFARSAVSGNGNGTYQFALGRCVGASYEGPVNVTVTASDTAGNQNTSEPLTLYFDEVPPQLGNLIAPASWVSRKTGTSYTVVPLQLNITDNGVGVAQAQPLTAAGAPYGKTVTAPSSGSLWTLPIDTSGAAQGAAGTLSLQVRAADAFGNQATSSVSILVDDIAPVIGADASNAANTAWHSSKAGNLSFAPSISLTDTGSGPGSATLSSGGSVVATASQAGQSGVFIFSPITLPSDPSLETNSYSMTVNATDVVGNPSTGTISFQVDNKAPAYGTPSFASASGGAADSAGRVWFKGADLFSGSVPPIEIDAPLTELYLNQALATPPAGAPVSGCTGTAPSYSCQFLMPRPAASTPANASYNVILSATDQALNNAAPVMMLLYIDDALPAKVMIAADTNWYLRSTTFSISANLPTLPASGVNPFDPYLLFTSGGAGCSNLAPSSVTDDGTGGKNLVFTLPATCAPAGVDGPLNFAIQVKSLVGATSTQTGFRNVDDAGPQIAANTIVIDYPASAGALAIGWSQDGSHFARNYNGNVVSFSAFDCGAGIDTTPALTVGGQPGTPSATLITSGPYWVDTVAVCGRQVPVYRFDFSLNLATIPAATLTNGTSTTLSWSGLVADSFGGTGHQTSVVSNAGNGVNVTRKLWQTGALAATTLSLGPTLVVSTSSGLLALSTSLGAAAWSYAGYSGTTSVGGTVAAPAVYFLAYSSTTRPLTAQLNSLDASTGAVGSSCSENFGSSGPKFPLSPSLASLAIATSGRPAAVAGGLGGTRCITLPDGTVTCTDQSSFTGWFGGASCSSWWTQSGEPGPRLVFGRGGTAFYQWAVGGDAADSGIDARSVSSGSITGTSSMTGCGGSIIAGDNAGSDAVYCDDDQKWTFSAASSLLTSSWPVISGGPGAPFLIGPSQSSLLAAKGTQTEALALANGSATYGPGGFSPWLIDANATLYSTSGASLLLLVLDSNGAVVAAGVDLPALPGATTTDMLMDRNGILYIANNGQVSAIITDAPGLGTANNAWPITGHDACRSYNLEYACPY